MLTSKATTKGLVMWCWGTCVLWRWFLSSWINITTYTHVWLPNSMSHVLCSSSSGVHQLPAEARWGFDRVGEGQQETEEAGNGLQGVRAAEGVLPAPQHVPTQANPAPHALQTHPGETMQTLLPWTPRSRRLQGWVLIDPVINIHPERSSPVHTWY